MSHETSLLLFTLIAVAGLILLIARFKANPIIAIVLAALFIGLTSGMELSAIMKRFTEGVGGVLGSIAMILGLGSMLGKLMAESGGAERIALTLIHWLGDSRVHWTILVIACIVGVPVFFQVGLVLLMPLAFIMAQKTKMPLLQIGIPLVSGLSVMHGLVPPHPGPMVAVEVLKADVGKTILYSVLVGIPTAIIAGPLLGNFLARRVPLQASGELMAQFTSSRRGDEVEALRSPGNPPATEQNPSPLIPLPIEWGEGRLAPVPRHQESEQAQASPSPPLEERAGERRPSYLPGFAITVFTILLPVLLMLLATAVDLAFPRGHAFRQGVDFIGHPIVALLIALLFSFYSLGCKCGFDRQQILGFTNDCLAPLGAVILVIGAGGGFKEVLVGSGVGAAIAERASHWHLSPVLFAWLVAALIRIAIGSATVAITTAAGLVLPVASGVPGVNLELVVVAMGAGSLILSHVNDGGFWLVKEYFNMSVTQTLKTWTVMETIISIVALVFTLLLNAMLT